MFTEDSWWSITKVSGLCIDNFHQRKISATNQSFSLIARKREVFVYPSQFIFFLYISDYFSIHCLSIVDRLRLSCTILFYAEYTLQRIRPITKASTSVRGLSRARNKIVMKPPEFVRPMEKRRNNFPLNSVDLLYWFYMKTTK